MVKQSGFCKWFDEEFKNLQLGDLRLNNRLKKIGMGFSKNSERSISKTLDRIKLHKRVLLIQDTVVYSYPNRGGSKNLSLISKYYDCPEASKGIIGHGMLALSDQGIPLGIVNQEFIDRKTYQKNGRRCRQEYQRLPIETKESYKWIKQIDETRGRNFLIRACHNRAINKTNRREPPREKLMDRLASMKAKGRIEVTVNSKRKGRKFRLAKLSVKYLSFSMAPPPNRTVNNSRDLSMFNVTAVMAIEKNCPADEEQINWVLLTNLPVPNLEMAIDKVKLYSMRWNIELFHKIIKSGLGVEKAQLRDGENLKKYIAFKSILDWRIFHLSRFYRHYREESCDLILTRSEWKILFKKFNRNAEIPRSPPTIEATIIWIARLGGFINRKGDGDPGYTSLWRGWSRFMQMLQDYEDICG